MQDTSSLCCKSAKMVKSSRIAIFRVTTCSLLMYLLHGKTKVAFLKALSNLW